MSSGESSQDGGERGIKMFEIARAVAMELPRATNIISGESGQGVIQEWKMFQIAVALATRECYQEIDHRGELGREMFQKVVARAMEIRKELLSPLPVISPWVTEPSSDDSPSNCCYTSSWNRMYNIVCLGGLGETLIEYTGVKIAAEDFGLKVQVNTEEYIDALRVFDVPKRARLHRQNIRVGGRPYTIRPTPNGSIIEPRATPIQVVDRGSQTVFFDDSGAPCVIIPINLLQHGDQGFLATTRNGEDGPGKVAQNALMSAFGGVVPLCFSTLDDALKDNCPGYIRAATYAGLVVITGITFVGLLSKKRAKAALRVVASAAIAAVSMTIVYKVPEDVYIKATCGVLGALATFVTMAIGW